MSTRTLATAGPQTQTWPLAAALAQSTPWPQGTVQVSRSVCPWWLHGSWIPSCPWFVARILGIYVVFGDNVGHRHQYRTWQW